MCQRDTAGVERSGRQRLLELDFRECERLERPLERRRLDEPERCDRERLDERLERERPELRERERELLRDERPF